MFEIERKFLITRPIRDMIREHADGGLPPLCENIQQVYLPDTGQWAVRARMITKGAFDSAQYRNPFCREYLMTMKRKKNDITAIEIEHSIPETTYFEFMEVCGHRPLNKNRWYFHVVDNTFMVDEFLNPEFDNLVVAEIELKSEDQMFDHPEWLGDEVTGQNDYINAVMVKKLFR